MSDSSSNAKWNAQNMQNATYERQSAAFGQTGGIGKECARPSLRERVDAQLSYAQQEANQANRLAELQYLLEKNPDVARILDLMESLKG